MPVTLPIPKSPPPSDTSEQKPATCDPCKWPVKRGENTVPCGWIGVSLRPHLKAHKKRDGSTVTIKEYQVRYPSANVGRPSFEPTPADIEKFKASSPHHSGQPKEPKPEPVDTREEQVSARTEELWAMVARDPSAKNFCREVAEDEYNLERLRGLHTDFLNRKAQPTKWLSNEISTTSVRIAKTMKGLQLTVDSRRSNSKLGNDTVAQIISNYAGTLRKWSPERRQLFHERVGAVRIAMAERIRLRLLSEAPDLAEDARLNDSSDYADRIRQIGDIAGASK